LFAQKQFQYKKNTNIILGSRIDKNSLYPLQLSPKAAIAYRINPDLVVKASVGAGFKAPDFRQQFLNFSNSLIGYTLLGAQELMHGLETLKKNGQIDQSIDISQYDNQKKLSPEKSIGVNAGFDYTFKNGSSNFKLNFFRNDISNLIEAYNLPFNKINNQSIYSYQNLNKVFTEGVEAGFLYSLNKNFSISGGYQYLIAKDKEVLRLIKEQKLYKRDPVTNKTTLVTKDGYKGLFNRSRNTANLRLQYNNVLHKGSFFLTAKYRGRYGFSGLNGFQNGNDVLDDDREFVHGFGLINATLSKQFCDSWEVQAGLENILNYRNKLQMPNMFGRTFFINVNFKI
jgi:outer membrane receptor for ferrienterochelin and colicins